MRTSTAAWAAAVAVMSMRGPFTTAEAAPARQADQQRHAPVFPRVMKRQFNTSTPVVPVPQNLPPPSSPPPSTFDASTLSETTSSDAPLPLPSDNSTDPSIPPSQPPSAGRASTAHVSAIPLLSALSPGLGSPSTPLPPLTSSVSVAASSTEDSRAHGFNTPIAPGQTQSANSGAIPQPNGLHGTGNLPLGTGAAATPPAETSSGGLLGGVVPNVVQSLPTSDPLAPLLGGTGTGAVVPGSQASPTPRPLPSTDSTTSNIIVGLTSAFTNVVPGLAGTGTGSAATPHGRVKQTQSGLLGGAGITVLPTGSVLSNVLPTATDGPLSILGQGTGARGSATTTNGILPLGVTSNLPVGSGLNSALGGVTSGLSGAVGGVTSGLSGAVGGVTSGLSGAVGGLGTVASQLTGTGNVNGIPGVVSGVTHAIPTGVTGVLPTGVFPTGTGSAGLVPAILSSVQSEVTGIPAGAPVSALQSSLDSKLSGIAATATDPAVVASLQSGLSSILTNAGTGALHGTPTIPVPLSDVTNGLPTLPGSALTLTAAGSTVIVPIPTSDGHSGGFPGSAPFPGATGTKSSGGAVATTGTATNAASAGTQTADSANSTVTTEQTVAAGGSSTTSSAAASTPANTTSAAVATSTDKTKHAGGKFSIKPTGTDSDTSMTLPTTWTFAPSEPTGTESGNAITMASSGSSAPSASFPTAIPQLVQPPSGMPTPPENTTLIQIGFNFGLNYEFVVKQRKSAPEIFLYLPKGIAQGLGISQDNISMNALMPYDTSASLGYITTLAQAYIPSSYVTQLQLDIHTPSAPIYFSDELPVKTLMNMINPSIAILPGAPMEDGAPLPSGPDPAANGGPGVGRGAPIGGDAGNTSTVKTSSVGIGIGAIGGAAVYAAAMVYIARRYRQRRKGHQRASSVPTAGEMAQRPGTGGMGGFFMSGANGTRGGSARNSASQNSAGRNSRTSNGSSNNGRSIREQGISAPLMSENSLGWN